MAVGNRLVGIIAYLMVHRFLVQVEAEIQTRIPDVAESIPG